MKFQVHNSYMVIYIQYKFLEILFISYLVLAEDERADRRTENGWTEGQRQTNIFTPSVGDKKAFYELIRVRQVGTSRSVLQCFLS